LYESIRDSKQYDSNEHSVCIFDKGESLELPWKLDVFYCVWPHFFNNEESEKLNKIDQTLENDSLDEKNNQKIESRSFRIA